MLSIRGAFVFLFCVLFVLFLGLSYGINLKNNQTQALKEAKQRIQSAVFVLQKSNLASLTSKEIEEFAQNLGVHIQREDHSSGQIWQESASPFYENGMMYQKIKKDHESYIISLVPTVERDFWNPLLLAGFMLCVLGVFGFLYRLFGLQFASLLSSLGDLEKNSTSLMFFEMNLFSKQLQRLKTIMFKKEAKNIKQAKKIKLKNAQLSNLLSAISHELKNPLSVMKLALEGIENPAMQNKEMFIQKFHHQISRLNMLTHKLNFVFNLDANQIYFEEFDLFASVEKITEAQGESRIKLEGSKSVVWGDVFLIEQVVINLISNALKYSQGEVWIKIEKGKFQIKDQGIGIAQDQYKKITKKFYKINSKSENSFGLGLFIVKKILAMHGSVLEIDSEVGKGTTFSFRLNRELPKE